MKRITRIAGKAGSILILSGLMFAACAVDPGLAPTRGAATAAEETASADRVLRDAFETQRSSFFVGSTGVVERTLTDDRRGIPHQRFIVRLRSGQTLLVSHNLNLAERIPLKVGDTIAFYGMYEWNDQGGVIHWTHDDPSGKIEGGWIDHDGRRYR